MKPRVLICDADYCGADYCYARNSETGEISTTTHQHTNGMTTLPFLKTNGKFL